MLVKCEGNILSGKLDEKRISNTKCQKSSRRRLHFPDKLNFRENFRSFFEVPVLLLFEEVLSMYDPCSSANNPVGLEIYIMCQGHP